jgi:lipid II:glycine glycyltransferase (peptidoglycan interpeptide bridge formation enzyme)
MTSTWVTEVDGITPEQWAQTLDLFNDANIYQTYSYGKIRWGAENLSHLILKRNGEIVAAAQVRIVRPTALKFGMAYLRWGPLCERRGAAPDAEVFSRMAQALEEEYAGKRALFLRIIPNAFVGTPRAEILQSAFSMFSTDDAAEENVYRTFVLDLAPSVEELRKKFDVKWRNQLTRSEKNNLTIVAGNGMEEYRMFREMYDEMMARKKFDTSVSVEEFRQIQEDLPGQQRMYTLIAQSEGVPVAALVASAMGDSAIYLLGATSDAGLTAKGAYILHWTMMQHLKAAGIRWYDLGGIDPEKNPGVYHFKKGMSGVDVCQMRTMATSKSAVSAALAKAGMAVQRALHGSSGTAQFARAIKQFATKN